MKQVYSSFKNEDQFILTDFCCDQSQELLEKKGLYKILWSRSSEVFLTVDGYRLPLAKNQLLFCTPINIVEVPKENEGLIAFVFNKAFFCIQTYDDLVSCNGFLFFGSAQPQLISLNREDQNRFKNLKKLIEEDFSIKDRLQGEMLRSNLKRLLIISTRLAKTNLPQPEMTNDQFDLIRKYNLLVEKHFREFHQVQEYASLLFKSPKTLSNIFPKYSDKTPLQVINERILLEAKRLLLYSSKSTDEIALELGYSDSSHFSKFFKKQEGTSPSVYKKTKLTEHAA